MLEYITEYDIAAEAEMVRVKFKGTILFLEGRKDILFLAQFIDTGHCYLILAHSKDNALGAIQILERKGFPGIIAIVDADYWYSIGEKSLSSNVINTDSHDTELMIIHLGKPPALPGDSQSLTFPGLYESSPAVNRSKFTERKAFVWMSIKV